jgi:hypothetical protein
MKRLALVETAQDDIEIAVLKLSNEEHQKLHANALDTVNDNHVFAKKLRKMEVSTCSHAGSETTARLKRAAPAEEPAAWACLIVHYPSCCGKATCTSL